MSVRGVPHRDTTPDPFALVELAADLRPADYAALFAGLAADGSSVKPAITVAAVACPDWLQAVLEQPSVETAPLAAALQRYAASAFAMPPMDRF